MKVEFEWKGKKIGEMTHEELVVAYHEVDALFDEIIKCALTEPQNDSDSK